MTSGRNTTEPAEELAEFLGRFPPFDTLGRYALTSLAEAAREQRYQLGDVLLDAFTEPSREMGVVLSGRVAMWTQLDRGSGKADQRLGPGEAFGFSAMLGQLPTGPRIIALGDVTLAWLPEEAVLPAFATPGGVRYLATQVLEVRLRSVSPPSFSLVEELITRPPLLVERDVTVGEVARLMTEAGNDYAAVRLEPAHRTDGSGPWAEDARYGLITDRLLRRAVLGAGRSTDLPVAEVMDPDPPTAVTGDSAAEAMIALLDRDADIVLILDRAGVLRGAAGPRDFALSPTTAGVALHEQLRHAAGRSELIERGRRMPSVLADLLERGLASSKVVAVYSSMIDTVIRRAIQLVAVDHPELDADDFTWLSLGSNGRREAVPSSDIDSAVSFVDHIENAPDKVERIDAHRAAIVEVMALLAETGLRSDSNGASANRRVFARTGREWRTAALGWLDAPTEHQGAMMTSLLIDARPIHGDRGLTEVSKAFTDLRKHPETMRLLLTASLANRAKQRSIRDLLARRGDTFDIKKYALLPIVNIARWAALTVGSAELPTIKRLQVAAGSAMLPEPQARTLVEVFEVLQRLRLDWQLDQVRAEQPVTDVLSLAQLSPIDRSVIAQAVREISAVQRRMDNVAQFVPTDEWTTTPSR